MDEGRVRPFSCGSQCADFKGSNCDRCTKGYDEVAGGWKCQIEEAIDAAWLDDGTVSLDIAARMGFTPGPPFAYVWPCKEVDWTPEWRAEWEQRQTLRYRVGYALSTTRRRLGIWARDAWQRARQRILWPIAERRGMRDPQGCWAAWCAWAMGYLDKPGPQSGATCRSGLEPGESCWCGKYCAAGPETEVDARA